MVYRAIPMPENGSLTLAARSDRCCRRTLHGIHRVIDRMQGLTCPFNRFGCHRPLQRAAGVHGTADTTRNKQPGEETHLPLKRRNGCAERLPPLEMPAPIKHIRQTPAGRPICCGQGPPGGPRPGRCQACPAPAVTIRTEHTDTHKRASAHLAGGAPYNFPSAVLRVDQYYGLALAARAFAESVRRAAR